MFHVKQKWCAEDPGDGGGGGVSFDNAWREDLPENIRDWNEVKQSTSAESFWEQMANMRSMMGQSIRIPTSDASKEDQAAFNQRLMEKVPNLMQKPDATDETVMAAFYDQMGRPEKSDDYSAPTLEAPDGITLQEGLAADFKAIAHKYGLNQKQYEGVLKDYTQNSIDAAQVGVDQHKAGMKALTDEWGAKYDDNYERAEAVRAKYFGDVVPTLDIAGAETVKAFAGIAERFGSEGSQALIEANRSDPGGAMVPAEAAERLNDILSNKDHAYWHADDPANKQAREKVNSLTKMANPQMSQDKQDFSPRFGS